MKRSAQELVRLCLKKDSLAWEEFVRRFSNLIYWAIERSFTRCKFPFHPEDLEDAFQQVFSYLWEKGLKDAEGVDRLEGWLVMVSYRIAIDTVRKEGASARRSISLEGRMGTEGEKSLADLLPGKEKNPREHAEEKLFEESLQEILGRLTEKESCVLRLNLIEEKTHAEISELLKIPIGTISSLIQRTKEKVAKALKGRLGGK
ncbi:MAG: sigma-70 family RNA polymerase sigma factor [Candidatus Omnitrophica bacterium]|nr:sigma-70 family RNA polymerase sigma factor [Candidatus Omnitrophota bacterium]